MSPWFEQFIGKPWARVPQPPKSFNCGELVRFIYKGRFNVDTPIIYADAGVLRECCENFTDKERYGLYPVDTPRPFDLAFIARCQRHDHVGLAIQSAEGLGILHCAQGIGVTIQSPAELLGCGNRHIDWFRHKDVTEEMALCPA
jgi:hypothetical protein